MLAVTGPLTGTASQGEALRCSPACYLSDEEIGRSRALLRRLPDPESFLRS